MSDRTRIRIAAIATALFLLTVSGAGLAVHTGPPGAAQSPSTFQPTTFQPVAPPSDGLASHG